MFVFCCKVNAKGADVYSYDEDDMVEDTNLSIHLAHFGINMNKMEKSDKTMAELEIDLNQKVGEWDRIQGWLFLISLLLLSR